jgi:hypothetical protein
MSMRDRGNGKGGSGKKGKKKGQTHTHTSNLVCCEDVANRAWSQVEEKKGR